LGTPTGNHYIVIGFRATNVFTCAFFGNDYDTTVTYTDTNWHLWTCTYNASTNKRTLYRDGALVGGDTPPSPFVGSGVPESGYYPGGFVGDVDDVRVYGKTLTAQAIRKLYAEGKPAHPDSLATR
jgi:hypothetical protein